MSISFLQLICAVPQKTNIDARLRCQQKFLYWDQNWYWKIPDDNPALCDDTRIQTEHFMDLTMK